MAVSRGRIGNIHNTSGRRCARYRADPRQAEPSQTTRRVVRAGGERHSSRALDTCAVASAAYPSGIRQDVRRRPTHNDHPVTRPTPVRARRITAQLVHPITPIHRRAGGHAGPSRYELLVGGAVPRHRSGGEREREPDGPGFSIGCVQESCRSRSACTVPRRCRLAADERAPCRLIAVGSSIAGRACRRVVRCLRAGSLSRSGTRRGRTPMRRWG